MADIHGSQNRFLGLAGGVDLGLYGEIELLAEIIDLIDDLAVAMLYAQSLETIVSALHVMENPTLLRGIFNLRRSLEPTLARTGSIHHSCAQ